MICLLIRSSCVSVIGCIVKHKTYFEILAKVFIYLKNSTKLSTSNWRIQWRQKFIEAHFFSTSYKIYWYHSRHMGFILDTRHSLYYVYIALFIYSCIKYALQAVDWYASFTFRNSVHYSHYVIIRSGKIIPLNLIFKSQIFTSSLQSHILRIRIDYSILEFSYFYLFRLHIIKLRSWSRYFAD